MDRRAALSTLAVALCGGCLSNAPGPTGPRNPPSEPANDPRRTPVEQALSVTTFDFDETDDGNLRVYGVVENTGEVERVARVRVSVSANGKEAERTTEVTVPAGRQTRFEVVFDVTYKAFSKGGSIDIDLV